jgi:signal transduction histidine kinase/CheY-like chemotaxis protein
MSFPQTYNLKFINLKRGLVRQFFLYLILFSALTSLSAVGLQLYFSNSLNAEIVPLAIKTFLFTTLILSLFSVLIYKRFLQTTVPDISHQTVNSNETIPTDISQELEALINALTAHVAILDNTGKIIFTNQAWNRFAEENSNGDMSSLGVGVNYLEVCKRAGKKDQDVLFGILDVLRGSREVFTTEYACHSKTAKRWFFMQVHPISNQKAGSLIITHANITDRFITTQDNLKIKDAALRANQAKSAFIANMSHEIRTPMNSILGYTQILLSDNSLTLAQKKWLEIILANSENLLEQINDILDISKIEAGHVELTLVDFNLKDLILNLENLFKINCERKQLLLKFDGVEQLTMVHGDEIKLRQILINLIGNAIKFTDTGRIHLKVTVEKNDLYQFVLKDTGPGISEENMDLIFEPFRQDTKSSHPIGTGLGLAISKNYAELMGGNITVNSKVGEGSTFTLLLPLPQAKRKVFDQPNKLLQITHLKKGYSVNALVADDNENNRNVLTSLLKKIGVEVTEATNGKEAIEKIRQKRPDIIFMDIQMPVMNGIEAIQQLNKEFPKEQLNIVVVSAGALSHEREQYKNLGCKEVTLKPFRAEQIFDYVKDLVGVEYEYKTKTALEPVKEIDYSKVNFCNDLLSKLYQAALMYNITAIEQLLNEVVPSNDSEVAFLKKLKGHLDRFEGDDILLTLEKLNNLSKPSHN